MMKLVFALLIASTLVACNDKKGSQDSGTTPTDMSTAGDGPGDGTSGGDGANAACTMCATTSCATQYNACAGDTACKCTYDCYVGMEGGEGFCKQKCSSNANMPWADLIDCLDAMCTCPAP